MLKTVMLAFGIAALSLVATSCSETSGHDASCGCFCSVGSCGNSCPAGYSREETHPTSGSCWAYCALKCQSDDDCKKASCSQGQCVHGSCHPS